MKLSFSNYCLKCLLLIRAYTIIYFNMPILDENTLDFISRSAEQTRRIGFRLGTMLMPGDVICLEGNLGAGKTTFVQGVAKGWRSVDPVSSPTFVLINVYRRQDGMEMAHLDAYRLMNADEAEMLDLDYLMENVPLLVEWAGNISEALPDTRLYVKLEHLDEDQRSIYITPVGERAKLLADSLKTKLFGA